MCSHTAMRQSEEKYPEIQDSGCETNQNQNPRMEHIAQSASHQVCKDCSHHTADGQSHWNTEAAQALICRLRKALHADTHVERKAGTLQHLPQIKGPCTGKQLKAERPEEICD